MNIENAWLTANDGTKVQDMESVIEVTVPDDNLSYLKSLYVSKIKFEFSLSKTAKDLVLVSAPENADIKINNDATARNSVEIDITNLEKLVLQVKFTFAWKVPSIYGEATEFHSDNPYVYYNSNTEPTTTQVDAAVAKLEALSKIDTSFVITVKATVVESTTQS